MRKYFKYLYGFGGLIVLLAATMPTALAAAANPDIPGAVTQSYNADPSVLTGMIVEFKAKDQTTVTPLTSKDIRNMLGVVVPVNDAPIVLTPQAASTQQVLVATSGSHDLLISNQNGAVKSGDYLTVSAVAGIGMKADKNQDEVIGRAASSFDGTSDVLGTLNLKGSLGHTTSVSVGRVVVAVQLAPNPLVQKVSNNLPGFLSKAANGVANRPVSTGRIYLSAVVLLATIFVVGSILYSGVGSGIVAIGRNPLAKKAIGRGLAQTIMTGLAVFATGIVATYLVLNL